MIDKRFEKPAFPVANDRGVVDGMTLQQWYAGMALQGLTANPTFYKDTDKGNDYLVETSFELAQRMIMFGVDAEK